MSTVVTESDYFSTLSTLSKTYNYALCKTEWWTSRKRIEEVRGMGNFPQHYITFNALNALLAMRGKSLLSILRRSYKEIKVCHE